MKDELIKSDADVQIIIKVTQLILLNKYKSIQMRSMKLYIEWEKL